jgi:hypothetical protein
MQRPEASEYIPYFDRYISLVTEEDVLGLIERQIGEVRALLGPLSEERSHYRYADGKWSVRAIVDHLIDAERLFGYRAFCVSRGETKSLPGFDQDDYAAASNAEQVDLGKLLDEWEGVRRSNLTALRRVGDGAWTHVGSADGGPISTRAVAFVLAGHIRHHQRVLAEKYGIGAAS